MKIVERAKSEHPVVKNKNYVKPTAVSFNKRNKDVFVIRPNNMKTTFVRKQEITKTKDEVMKPGTSRNLDISIPGLRRLFGPEYGFVGKTLWGLAIVCCTILCLSQLAERVKLYFTEPLIIDISVKRLQNVNFPSVTLCPARLPIHEGQINTQHIKNGSEENSLTTDGKTIYQLWNQFQINEDAINVVTSCVTIPNVSNCDKQQNVSMNLSVESINTIWGTCTVLTSLERVEFRGTYTYMDIYLFGLLSTYVEGREAVLQYFIHSNGLQLKHDAFFIADFIFEDSFTTIRLAVKEFNFKNTTKDPCVDPVTATKCRNECIDMKLNNAMKCSLPFMERSTLPLCNTFEDISVAYKQAHRVYTGLKSDECICQRPCKEVMYSMAVDVENELKNNYTVISLYYAENLLEVVNENYAYPFSALLSDIGGNLGFFLGISILTMIEVVEGLIQGGGVPFCKACRRPIKRARSKHHVKF